MRKNYKYTIGIAIVLVFILLALCSTGSIGVPKPKIESDARKSQKIEDHWQVSRSISYPIGVLLFYDTESNDFIYSIYLNRKGFSFGYFFRNGGIRSEIKEGICEFRYNGFGRALLSMNKDKVDHIEIDNGQIINTIRIDSEKPFTLVLPENCGMITIYDINNNTVPITSVLVND